MSYRLYTDLAPWWPHVSQRESLAAEASVHLRLIDDALGQPAKNILELGSGGGLLAKEIEADRTIVLTDISPEMLEQSRKINPEREHILGDMRSLRLGRTFDAVLLHDAVMYLTSPDDLAATFATAAAHLNEGGVLLVLPDVVKETFEEGSVSGGSFGTPAAQLLEWHWDPDPDDDTYRVDMCFMLRHEDGRMETVHEHHEMGLFDRATLCRLIRDAGFNLVQGTVWEAVDVAEFFTAVKKVS
jgi:SAM-dependent methyltransferase